MTPHTKVVLVTACGCKKYTDWPACSMRREIIVPLYVTRILNLMAEPELKPSRAMAVRRFEATGKYEILTGGETWAVYQEVYEEPN